MFMTSCLSRHWVETIAFQGQHVTVLAARSDEEFLVEVKSYVSSLQNS